jgi:hypothetical protein
MAVLEQFLERTAGPNNVSRQVVHLEVALIAENNPRIGIEYADALRNIVDSEFELLFAASRRG